MTLDNFPTTRPAFTANFARSQQLPPQVNFTRTTTGTYTTDTGSVATAPVNVPRFNWENGRCQGLLIEEARTNQEIWSTEFSNWTNNGGAMDMTDNAEVAPDGTTTACRFIQSNTTNATRSISSRAALVRNGQQSAQTLWVRRVSGTDPQPTITLTAIGAGGGGTSIVPTNEWQKITKISTNINDGNSYYCQVLTIGWDINGAANNNVYAFWGSQFENNTSFATSYIPTSGAAATRAQDVCEITGDDFSSWYNGNEGTIVSDVIVPSRECSYYSFTGTTYISALSYVSPGTLVQSTGSQLSWTGTSYSDPVKVAVSYNDLEFVASRDGGTVQSDPSTVNKTGIDRVYFGRFWTGTNFAKGVTISRISYYPTRVSNDALEALTQ